MGGRVDKVEQDLAAAVKAIDEKFDKYAKVQDMTDQLDRMEQAQSENREALMTLLDRDRQEMLRNHAANEARLNRIADAINDTRNDVQIVLGKLASERGGAPR
jgi:hypothetical protein